MLDSFNIDQLSSEFIDPNLLISNDLDSSSLFTDADSQSIFQAKKKERKSYVWWPENGEEYQENGKERWKCKRCPNLHTAITFTDSSTHNAIDHLKKIHGITKANLHGLSLPSQSQIRIAFQNTIPKIVFNEDLFKFLLL